VDNGGCIIADDLAMAFARHATSKLASTDDLARIGTLGFRGEALASIGGVAQVTLQSRPPDETFGTEVTCHGGELSPVRAWNGAPGTRVEVRHLFYNTPVRRKFLRSIGTEMGQISEAFTRLALAQLRLHLTLRHNGKVVYEVPASAGLLDRIALFFGTEVSGHLYPVEAEQGHVTVGGYVADPACDRGNSALQYWFVNGRWIRDRSLTQALHEAYRGLLMTGRYTVAFLFLELPPDRVDVNVHPTKAEVRFRDPEDVHQLVLTAVRDRLRAADLTAKMRMPGPARLKATPAPKAATPGSAPRTPPEAPPAPPAVAVPRPTAIASSVSQSSSGRQAGPMPASPVKAMQVHDAYLVVEVPEGILVIDQHALHERILFEKLQERLRSGTLAAQRLLVPEAIKVPVVQAAHALEHRAALARLGLGVEDFGGGTLLLTSYPAILGKCPPATVLRAVVDHLVAKEKVLSQEQLLNDLLSLMACHAAVRSGDRLTPEEVAALAAQRELAQDTHHCPHGRPTSLLFTRQDLDRQFRRT
jgi:DNA mismatch repair protein MutL